MPKPMWTPSPQAVANSNLYKFRNQVNRRHGLSLVNYPEIYQWSIDRPEEFWAAMWDFAGIIHSNPFDRVLDNPSAMPGAKWFPGARLNFAENLLRYRDDRPAIVFNSEAGHREELTYAELFRLVCRAARGLKAAGVGVGDRVVGFMPNMPQTAVAMLAATSLGAIWSSCSPDFGIASVLDRFQQIDPKVIFTADGYFYNGKTHDSLSRMGQVLASVPSLSQAVVVPYVNQSPDLSPLPGKPMVWEEFLGDPKAPEPEFAQVPFDHPIYIVYSSGTSGAPKCIVHGMGAALIQLMKEHLLHCDVRREDRFFYFSTCGWVMWNWLHGVLASGATIFEYDGSPFVPEPATLWRMAEREKLTVFGTSARYLDFCQKEGLTPGRDYDLSRLRLVLSTGSVLAPETFDYVYREISPTACLSSISGGTDILSAFATGCPTLPVYRGELQCRGLAMKMMAFDPEGKPVVGQKGELVCTAPFPAVPLFFWNDPDGIKFQNAYFDQFPGVWTHGDFVEITDNGGVIVYGRSDATLNPGGVRIGTAEIYRQVEKLPEIVDSIAVGQKWDNDVRVVLFVKLAEGVTLDAELVKRIRQVIKENATPRHIPAKILAVDDVPVTLSGKKVEQAVRNLVHGLPVENRDALANPGALHNFQGRPELNE